MSLFLIATILMYNIVRATELGQQGTVDKKARGRWRG